LFGTAPVVFSFTDAAIAEVTRAGEGAFDSSFGKGFFASSVLKPGGGNAGPPPPVGEVSVA